MGFLLMQYEYQRATTQYNLCERTGIRLNNQLDRYTKRVQKMESVFQKAQSRLETDWNQKQSTFSSVLTAAQNRGLAEFRNILGSITIGGVNVGSLISINEAEIQGAPGSQERAKNELTYVSSIGAQVSSIISQLITNAREADVEKLQIQHDMQLEPIAEKESEISSEVSTNDALISIWQERKEAAKSRLGEDIQSGISHYGLK